VADKLFWPSGSISFLTLPGSAFSKNSIALSFPARSLQICRASSGAPSALLASVLMSSGGRGAGLLARPLTSRRPIDCRRSGPRQRTHAGRRAIAAAVGERSGKCQDSSPPGDPQFWRLPQVGATGRIKRHKYLHPTYWLLEYPSVVELCGNPCVVPLHGHVQSKVRSLLFALRSRTGWPRSWISKAVLARKRRRREDRPGVPASEGGRSRQ
jgi:hypothetical protein